MSKRKPAKKIQLLSPENYIRQKARNLPIVECFITPNWKDCGECNIIVTRQHVSGNYTLGIYLIDVYCLGVKNAGYRYNINEIEYDEIKERFPGNAESINYNEVHNIIYGALAYAEDLGFKPHKDFGVAQYILEEDTDEIPQVDYEFGCDGKPHLIVNTRAELNRYLPILKKAVGDDFDFYVREDEEDDYEVDYEVDEDCDCEDCRMKRGIDGVFKDSTTEEREQMLKRFAEIQKKFEKSNSLPRAPYNYQHPDYPQTLELTHKELEVLSLPENNEKLERETIDKILALPRESLIKDLENAILYEIGQNYKGLSDESNDNEISYGFFAHALLLLAELKSTESLPVVLEVMRQNNEFYEQFFGDFAMEIFSPTLHQIARNQLPVLLSFVKEPGLLVDFKTLISTAVVAILHFEPHRRAEIIAWCGDLLDFLYENISNTALYDAVLSGMLMSDLMDICAKELLPKIKRLYDTDLVDEMICGNYNDVEKEINIGVQSTQSAQYVKSIYEIYK